MEKPFLVMVGVLIFMVFTVSIHYFTFDEKGANDSLSMVVEATQMAQPSWSVSYYEPRMFSSSNINNISYPEMLSTDRMDFVYVK